MGVNAYPDIGDFVQSLFDCHTRRSTSDGFLYCLFTTSFTDSSTLLNNEKGTGYHDRRSLAFYPARDCRAKDINEGNATRTTSVFDPDPFFQLRPQHWYIS